MKPTIQKFWLLMTMVWVTLSASAYDFEVDGIYYNITSMSDLEVEVTYSTNFPPNYGNTACANTTPYSGNVVIPPTVNYLNRTFTVTGIGDAAFGYPAYNLNSGGGIHLVYSKSGGTATPISSIIFPESIEFIGDCAFQGCNIQNITLPANLKNIGNAAFARTGLTSINLPPLLDSLGESAFRNSNIQSVVLGPHLTAVGQAAFDACGNLIEVFCTPNKLPVGLSNKTFASSHAYLDIYVPSVEEYGFGREYLTFSTSSFDYTGHPHHIEWTNNLKAYKCEIAETECLTGIDAGQHTTYLKAAYTNGIDISVEIPYDYTITPAPLTLTVHDTKRTYGQPNPKFTCEMMGLVDDVQSDSMMSEVTYDCTATDRSKVGTYPIRATLINPN